MRNTKARETAWTGMLFALAIALSYLESLVSPLLGLMPAIKLGLSNVVVMYALLFLRTRTALLLVVLKALFAFLTRGATAGFLSLCGGGLSLVVMLVLLHLPVSGYIFCAGAALAHNLGQLRGQQCCFPAQWLWGTPPCCWRQALRWAASALCFPAPYSLPCLPLRGSSGRGVHSKNKNLS